MNNIYIIGFMGTGKTAVSKALSRKTGKKRLDLDNLIETRENRKIAQIFTESGEAHFRKLEKEALTQVSQEQGIIVDCGGGIVLDKDNIELMKKSGIMICLTASPEVILERTKRHSHRPLLNVPDPKAKIIELLEARKQFYDQANYVVDTSDFKVEEVVIKILENIKNN